MWERTKLSFHAKWYIIVSVFLLSDFHGRNIDDFACLKGVEQKHKSCMSSAQRWWSLQLKKWFTEFRGVKNEWQETENRTFRNITGNSVTRNSKNKGHAFYVMGFIRNLWFMESNAAEMSKRPSMRHVDNLLPWQVYCVVRTGQFHCCDDCCMRIQRDIGSCTIDSDRSTCSREFTYQLESACVKIEGGYKGVGIGWRHQGLKDDRNRSLWRLFIVFQRLPRLDAFE